MTGTEANVGRFQLRERARHRLGRRMGLIILLVGPLAGLAIIIGGLVALGDTPPVNLILIGVGVALVTSALTGVVWLVQRRRTDPPLILGADPETRRAVHRAIRAGHSDDARIDLLARDLIARSPAQTWVPWVYVVLALLQVVLLLLGDRSTGDVIRALVTVPFFAVAAGYFWQHRRRMRRYRGLSA
ncbi:hypothetical protein [Micromonospora sp. NBC_01796]|uniref:hypothetical protein n=1 Tax=Micromonospora sp. NBC_01796 TaxID=2975987 RepID=UPI002DDC56E7|nr:hypothetical protein [Micromonospora sp. NBC_01796]WSA83126.1 hypothetical protein OIE47_22210 [Micromonospora sp. NBC_01796]